MFETLAILFTVVVAPIWIIFHYTSKRHADRRLTPDDERMLEDLWRSAKEMERRIQSLETITETEAPRRPAYGEPRSPGESVM